MKFTYKNIYTNALLCQTIKSTMIYISNEGHTYLSCLLVYDKHQLFTVLVCDGYKLVIGFGS